MKGRTTCDVKGGEDKKVSLEPENENLINSLQNEYNVNGVVWRTDRLKKKRKKERKKLHRSPATRGSRHRAVSNLQRLHEYEIPVVRNCFPKKNEIMLLPRVYSSTLAAQRFRAYTFLMANFREQKSSFSVEYNNTAEVYKLTNVWCDANNSTLWQPIAEQTGSITIVVQNNNTTGICDVEKLNKKQSFYYSRNERVL